MMNELALFAGAGGGLLASQHLLGFATVCYVELDAYCVAVLQARISDGYLDDAPVWDDVKTFDGLLWRGSVDLVTAGFPCQPWSVAGKQRGEEDDRNLWPDTIRIIREVKPRYCYLENVTGLLAGSHGYFGAILGDLADSGYDARWTVLSAAEVGAPHLRKRLWVLAYSTSCQRDPRAQERTSILAADDGKARRDIGGSGNTLADCQSTGKRPIQQPGHRYGAFESGQDVADTTGERQQGAREVGEQGCATPDSERQTTQSVTSNKPMAHPDEQGSQRYRGRGSEGECQCQFDAWACCRTHEDEPIVRSGIRRISHGVSHRVDRLKALGNAEVPEVARRAWLLLTENWSA